MEANNELPSEMQCKDKSLVLDTTVSKEFILHSITEDMSNIKAYDANAFMDVKKSQECLLPTPLWTSSTGSQNHQETAKESSETQQASDKTSPCTDRLLFLNTTASKDLAPLSVTGEMFINKTDGKVVDEEKFDTSFSPMPTLSESSTSNQNYQEGAQAFSEPHSAHDTTTKTEVIPCSRVLLDVYPLELRFCFEPNKLITCSLDLTNNTAVNPTFSKDLIDGGIIRGSSTGHVHIWNYDMQQKSVGSIEIPKGARGKLSDFFVSISFFHRTHKYANKMVILTAFWCVKFIERTRWFMVGSGDGFIHVYNYKRGIQKITSIKAVGGSYSYVYSLAIHPTESYVLSACHMEIKLFDWDRRWFGWKCIQTFKEHTNNVRAVAFNPEDCNSFASVSDDETIKVWSLGSPKSMYTLSGHLKAVNCLDFFTHGDGQQYLVTGSADKTAKIWDMERKDGVHTLPHRSGVCSVLPHPKFPLLITGTEGGDIYFWSSTNFRLNRILNISDLPVTGLACLNEPGRVAVSHTNRLSVIEIRDEEEQGGITGNDENSIS